MTSLDKIYDTLPTFLQNFAVSIKGLLIENTRKKGIYSNWKNAIRARRIWSREDFASYQLSQLNELIAYACKNVPYYARKLSGIDLPLKCLADIEQIPLLSREYLKEHSSEFISSYLSNKNKIILYTTGTTGSPLKIIADKSARQKNYAFFDDFLAQIGIKSRARHIVIGGRIIVSPDVIKPPFWRYSYFQNALLMSSYHLSDDKLGAFVDKIVSFNPEYIDSYPSSIFLIAKYMLKRGVRFNCKAIITSAETLLPEQREVIEQAFGTSVYDQYGSAEMAVFAAQCHYGNYHVRPDYGLLEIVDQEGKKLPMGEVGEVVCTSLINLAMPLIRYPIGDLAAYSTKESCPCGHNTPILDMVLGRKDDILYTSDGRSIGRMSPVLKGFPVKESQYVQYIVGEVVLLVVPDKEFNVDSDTDKIVKAVMKRLGRDFIVKVKIVDSIKRGKGGKFKAVKSFVCK